MAEPELDRQQILDWAVSGLLVDGGWHKQWYLEQIAQACGFELPDSVEQGEQVLLLGPDDNHAVDPDSLPEDYEEAFEQSGRDYWSFERGIAP